MASNGRIRVLVTLSFVVLFAAAASATSPDKKPETVVEVKGFRAVYSSFATPKSDWSTEQAAKWITSFAGKLTSQREIAYRSVILAPGNYDMWVEKGKGEWFQLVIGNRKEEKAPRLKAMFRLYEREEGVQKLGLSLKLMRKGTKLKFSLFAGSSEGHGNIRILQEEPGS